MAEQQTTSNNSNERRWNELIKGMKIFRIVDEFPIYIHKKAETQTAYRTISKC